MAERIIVFIVSVLCYLPWFYIGTFQKDSEDPISFWSGDTSLKEKVKDVKHYNLEMAQLYRRFSWLFLFSMIVSPFYPFAAVALLCAGSLIGIFFLYRSYKRILSKYS